MAGYGYVEYNGDLLHPVIRNYSQQINKAQAKLEEAYFSNDVVKASMGNISPAPLVRE